MKSDSAHSGSPIALEETGDDAVDSPSAQRRTQSRSLRELARTLTFSEVSTPGNIRARLGELRRFDRHSEQKQRLWMIWMVAAITAAVVSFFFVGSRAKGTLFLWAIPVMLMIAGIVCGALHLWHKGRNLDDHRYQIAEALVRYLSHDMSREAPLRLEIDFNGYRKKRYKTGGSGSILNSIVTSASYTLPWLSLKGSLLDGSRFRFSVQQIVKRKTKQKRKYRKVTEAFHDKITLIIQVKPKRYGTIGYAPELLRRAKLPFRLSLSKAEVNGNRLIVQADTVVCRRVKGRGMTGRRADQATCDHHELLGLFLACYHSLAQCRARR